MQYLFIYRNYYFPFNYMDYCGITHSVHSSISIIFEVHRCLKGGEQSIFVAINWSILACKSNPLFFAMFAVLSNQIVPFAWWKRWYLLNSLFLYYTYNVGKYIFHIPQKCGKPIRTMGRHQPKFSFCLFNFVKK